MMAIPPFEEIARIYKDATRVGNAPTVAVAEYYLRPHRTASHWVRLVRAAGLIEPFAGEQIGISPTTLAVANALGVSVQALRDAVIDHADGALRIAPTMHSSKKKGKAA